MIKKLLKFLGILVLVVVLAAALALYALSWRLSVAWYGKAEQ